jgi:hypothetical protein
MTHINPTQPTEASEKVHGERRARKLAHDHFLCNTVDAISRSWGPGAEICYRTVARANGLEARLERSLLDHALKVACPSRTCFLVTLLIGLLLWEISRMRHLSGAFLLFSLSPVGPLNRSIMLPLTVQNFSDTLNGV